ncbi:hypothetical protein PVAND_016949 [Polypedilum vanderplanki]|uniref:Papain family cysteine protease n=1 Tax=Polypedilum vanderplanki TaxID=319348 RepID=A0A9J6BHA5_POLVA|nr:hypothetical protein PVAND_016949 [Polypedilum vanderplanki]
MKITLVFFGFLAINLASSSKIFKIAIDLESGKEQNVEVVELDQPQEIVDEQEEIETDSFNIFLKTFNIQLENYEMRQKIFTKNYRKIRHHNERFYKGLETFEMAVNKFTHLTEIERKNFISQIHPREATNFSIPIYKVKFDDSELASSVNWVEKNKLQPIQDQGQCESCYAFAAIATIESQMIIRYNNWEKLSEQEAMECTKGCKGGLSQDIYLYSQVHGGCASENSYPYYGHEVNDCNAAQNRKRVSNSKCTGILEFGTSVEATMKAIEQFGPITAYMAIYNSFYNYNNGIYKRTQNDDEIQGYHAVTFVGYGQENGLDYWLVRNSWGKHWGQNGYAKFLKGTDECEIESLNHYGPQL